MASPIDYLLNLISPSEAEAKVVAKDAPTQALIDAIQKGTKVQEPAYLKGDPERSLVTGESNPAARYIYQKILQRAQDDPDTVTLKAVRDDENAGRYFDKKKAIEIDEGTFPLSSKKMAPGISTNPESQMHQDTAAHELLHFLLRDKNLSSEGQHLFISKMLGTPYSGVKAKDLMNAVPFTMPTNVTVPVTNTSLDRFAQYQRELFPSGQYNEGMPPRQPDASMITRFIKMMGLR